MPQFTLRTLMIGTAFAAVYASAIGLSLRHFGTAVGPVFALTLPLLGGFVGLVQNGWEGLIIGFTVGFILTIVICYLSFADFA